MDAARRALVYLRDTADWALTYGKDGDTSFFGHADAAHNNVAHKGKGTTGFAFQFCGGAVCWRSKTQGIVALSSASTASAMASSSVLKPPTAPSPVAAVAVAMARANARSAASRAPTYACTRTQLEQQLKAASSIRPAAAQLLLAEGVCLAPKGVSGSPARSVAGVPGRLRCRAPAGRAPSPGPLL